MKILYIATALILTVGTAHAGVDDYTPEQIKEMPRFSSIEQQRCPSARFPSVKKRLECKKEIRVHIYEKRQERQNQKSEGK